MFRLTRPTFRCPECSEVSRILLCALLLFTILWRGGKSLDAVWILTGVACIVTFISVRLVYNKKVKELREVPNILWWSTIGFVGVTIASFVFSSTANYGFDEVLRTTSCALLFLWLCRRDFSQEGDQKFLDSVLKTIAIAALVACIIGFAVYVLQPVNRFVGTFFDYRFHTDYWPNAWGDFILLAWPLVALWIIRTQTDNSLNSLAKCSILGVLFGALLLSYSRGSMIAFVGQIGLLLAAGAVRPDVRPLLQRTIPVLVLVAVIGGTVFLEGNILRSNHYSVQSVEEKVTFTGDEGMTSVSERSQFWMQAVRLGQQKPLLGWGPYSFRFLQPRFQQHVLATSDHPHNVLLKFFAERGVFALLLFASILAFCLLTALRTLGKEGETPFDTVTLFAGVSVCGALAHHLIDYNLQFVAVALLFWISLGLIVIPQVPTKKKRKVILAKRSFEGVLAFCLLLAAFYEGGYLATSSMGRHAEAAGQTELALQWYQNSSGERFSRDMHLSRAKLYSEKGDTDGARQALNEYFAQNGEDSRAWKRRGDVFWDLGEKHRAIAAYEKAYAMGRFNDLSITRRLVEALYEVNRKELRARREEFEDLLFAYQMAIKFNIHFIALSQNPEEFLRLAKLFERLYPKDAPIFQVASARVDLAARREREKLKSRKPGYLW